MFPRDVSVFGADGEGWGEGVVGQMEVLSDLPHQALRRFRGGIALSKESVEYRPAGVACLQRVLHRERLE